MEFSSEDEDAIYAGVSLSLNKWAKSPKKVLLCIDDFDLLESNQNRPPYWWLSMWENVAVVCVTQPEFNITGTYNTALACTMGAAFDRAAVVTARLREYKQLDAEQMKELLSKTDSTMPLYVVLASEELRIFGIFEKVSNPTPRLPRNPIQKRASFFVFGRGVVWVLVVVLVVLLDRLLVLFLRSRKKKKKKKKKKTKP
eukprot:TRINITY_DN14321_c0_g1_i1.p3 TRINITY_DN14321_c0_g1~~TRINITY_DN14321_c0_g1_i1.p3  ORF type:complete len:199 (-),score=56.71 TRINITY_DN14321_c0_g1_i1:41-637(-)